MFMTTELKHIHWLMGENRLKLQFFTEKLQSHVFHLINADVFVVEEWEGLSFFLMALLLNFILWAGGRKE